MDYINGKEYVKIKELQGNEDLHEIAIRIKFEDNESYLPKDTTREKFIEEIISELDWQLDMSNPPVNKSVLLTTYDEILKIKEKEEIQKNKVKENNNTFKFEGKDYNLKVETYESSNLLKVSMIDKNNKETKEITMEGAEFVIPPMPTPDCVMINLDKDRALIDELLNKKLLDYCNSLFAKFNMNELYKYDKDGTKAFIDSHTVKIQYTNEKAKNLKYVKENLQNDIKYFLNKKEIKKRMEENFAKMPLKIVYCLIDKETPLHSIAMVVDSSEERGWIVRPYIKNKDLQFKYVYDCEFNFDYFLFDKIENGYEIASITDPYVHYAIWREIEEYYPEDIGAKKGMQIYLKYCKDNNITKEFLNKFNKVENTPDIMQYYKKKVKNRNNEVR